MADVRWLIESATKHLVETKQAKDREHALRLIRRTAQTMLPAQGLANVQTVSGARVVRVKSGRRNT